MEVIEDEREKQTGEPAPCAKSGSSVGFALLLVLAGCLWLGFNTGWISTAYKPIILSWQMLLVVCGLWTFLWKRHYAGGLLLLCVGAFFLLPVVGRHFPGALGNYPTDVSVYWPVLLIVAGVLFLAGRAGHGTRSRRRRCARRGDAEREWNPDGNRSRSTSDYVSKDMLFTGSEQVVFSSDYQGGRCNVAFGGLKLDLRRVEHLNPDNLLEINVVFGGAEIFVPRGWRLDIRSSSMFGSVEDRRDGTDRSGAGPESDRCTEVLHLKCASLFGGVEIKN